MSSGTEKFGTGQRVRFWGGEGFIKSVNEFNEAIVIKNDGKEVKVKTAELERIHTQNVTKTVTVTTTTTTTTAAPKPVEKIPGSELAASISEVKLKKTPQW